RRPNGNGPLDENASAVDLIRVELAGAFTARDQMHDLRDSGLELERLVPTASTHEISRVAGEADTALQRFFSSRASTDAARARDVLNALDQLTAPQVAERAASAGEDRDTLEAAVS